MILRIEEIEKRISDSYELPNQVMEVMPEPLVTVRTSTYQHEPYIRECIEGVLMQKTTFPVEYIIGEDFSTDGTREIVFDYAKKYPDRIRVFSADYNVGAKANGRRCTRASRGKYMALCEGDDYWTDPLKLQKQVDFLEANPEYGLVHTEVYYKYGNSQKIIKNVNRRTLNYCYLHKEDNLFDSIYTGDYSIRTLSVCMRTDLVKKVFRDNPDMLSNRFKMGDTLLWLELSKLCKFKFIPQATCVYNILDESATHSKDYKNVLSFYSSMFEFAYHYYKKYNIDERLYKRLNRRLLDQIIAKLFHERIQIDIKEFNAYMPKEIQPNFWQKYKINSINSNIKYWIVFSIDILKRIIHKIRKVSLFYIKGVFNAWVKNTMSIQQMRKRQLSRRA